MRVLIWPVILQPPKGNPQSTVTPGFAHNGGARTHCEHNPRWPLRRVAQTKCALDSASRSAVLPIGCWNRGRGFQLRSFRPRVCIPQNSYGPIRTVVQPGPSASETPNRLTTHFAKRIGQAPSQGVTNTSRIQSAETHRWPILSARKCEPKRGPVADFGIIIFHQLHQRADGVGPFATSHANCHGQPHLSVGKFPGAYQCRGRSVALEVSQCPCCGMGHEWVVVLKVRDGDGHALIKMRTFRKRLPGSQLSWYV